MSYHKELAESVSAVKNDKRILNALKGLNAVHTSTVFLGKLDNFVDALKEVDDGSKGDEECILVKRSIKGIEHQIKKEPQNAPFFLQDVISVIIPQVVEIIDMRKQYIDERKTPDKFGL